MVYTVFYRVFGANLVAVAECTGSDWWDALKNGNLKEDEVIAMVPGKHDRTIMMSNRYTNAGWAEKPMEVRVVDRRFDK